MQSTPPTFREWHEPDRADLGENHVDFLERLGGPTWITVDGMDNDRGRAIVTLLHGNEPSGLKAVHHILKSGIKPATRLGIFIASVDAALKPPVLSHRFLPDEQDLNRCFNPPYSTDQRKLACALLNKLMDFEPEAVIDAHNTSAHSEPFGVAVNDSPNLLLLTGMFTRKLVVMDLSLGTLIEQQGGFGPTVTIEFGGVMDPGADRIARDTLTDFVARRELFGEDTLPMTVLRHPHRLEIETDCNLHYSSSVQEDADITIVNTIDQLNFVRVEAATPIGWTGKRGLDVLRMTSIDGEDLVNDYFRAQDGLIVTRCPMIIFMATTDAYIARKDCLLYLTPRE